MAAHELDDRRDYGRAKLSEDELADNPFDQFDKWLADAKACAEIDEALAMTLATATTAGVPSARIVLLRHFDTDGFVFYSNYSSHKGVELRENPHAALVFYWGPLERQIRIEGLATKLSAQESDEYFATRPYKSQLAALASDQSSIVERSELIDRWHEIEAQYPEGTEVPRRSDWGGYRVTPERIEFWQGGRSRMHDRLQYERDATGWRVVRLAP